MTRNTTQNTAQTTQETAQEFTAWQTKAIFKLVFAVCKGFTYDPGHSDLDDEQPIHVQMTLGDYRRAVQLTVSTAQNMHAAKAGMSVDEWQ